MDNNLRRVPSTYIWICHGLIYYRKSTASCIMVVFYRVFTLQNAVFSQIPALPSVNLSPHVVSVPRFVWYAGCRLRMSAGLSEDFM